jgi:hypothetical protein
MVLVSIRHDFEINHCYYATGAGMSEGDFVSLGYYERDDLQSVTNYLMDRWHVRHAFRVMLLINFIS